MIYKTLLSLLIYSLLGEHTFASSLDEAVTNYVTSLNSITTFLPEARETRVNSIKGTELFIKSNPNLTNEQLKRLNTPLAKVKNYLHIEDTFSKCLKNKNNALAKRYLDTAGNSKVSRIDCSLFNSLNTTGVPTDDLEKIVDAVDFREIDNLLISQSLDNAINSYMYLTHHYEDSLNKKKDCPLLKCRPQAQVNFCNQFNCSPEDRRMVENLKEKYRSLHKGTKQTGTDFAVTEINQTVGNLNRMLKDPAIGVSEGRFRNRLINSDDPIIDDNFRQSYNSYRQEYMNFAANGPGLLMSTRDLRHKIGGLKLIEKDIEEDIENGKTVYSYSDHRNVTREDIELAVQQARNSIARAGSDLLTRKTNRNNQRKKGREQSSIKFSKNNIKRLIKSSPAAIGQILINYPEYTAKICSLMNENDQDKKDDEAIDTGIMIAGLVVGGALVVTGFGSAFGVGILSAASGSLAVTGAVIGATATIHHGATAFNARTDLVNYERAILANNGDKESLADLSETAALYQEKVSEMAYSIGFSVANIAALNTVVKSAHFGNKILKNGKTASHLSKVNNLFTRVLKRSEYSALFKKLQALNPGDKLGAFTGHLSYLEPQKLKAFLNQMLIWGPEKSSQIMNKFLKKVNNQCRL